MFVLASAYSILSCGALIIVLAVLPSLLMARVEAGVFDIIFFLSLPVVVVIANVSLWANLKRGNDKRAMHYLLFPLFYMGGWWLIKLTPYLLIGAW